MANHKDKPLVNIKEGTHSSITLINVKLKDLGTVDLTGWKVKGPITDKSSTPGKWNGVRSATGDQKNELRLILTCTKKPVRIEKKEDRADSGDLTITLTDGAMTKVVDPAPKADYADDTEP